MLRRPAKVNIQNRLEAIGAGIIFTAAVLAALGVMFTKTRNGLRVVRLKFAEQISDVVFSHPSFLHIDTKVDDLKDEIALSRRVAQEAKEQVAEVKNEVVEVNRELTLNGGASIKDKVNATHDTVSELSLRLGNVEQQLETAVVDSVEKAQKGGRRKDDPPHGEFGP